MADKIATSRNKAGEVDQQLVGFMSTVGWEKLLVQVSEQIEEFENHPHPEVSKKVLELLAGVDAIHREALGRLVSLFKEGVLEQVVTDPAIHTLMELYDLLPEDPETSAESNNGFPNIPLQINPAARKSAAEKQAGFPHWVPLLASLDLIPTGSVRESSIEGQQILLCRVGDEVFALESRCTQDGTPLTQASLSAYTLSCPNHTGCYYDVRSGSRIAGEGTITCYNVKHEDNAAVLVGLNMDFSPNLPTF